MMFDKKTKNLICNGLKVVTRRKFNPDRRPAIPGAVHKIKIDRTKKVYGEIEIIACYPQKFGDITEDDAHYEGFNSLWEYKKYFFKKNGFIESNDLIWVIEFKVKWHSREGVILNGQMRC